MYAAFHSVGNEIAGNLRVILCTHASISVRGTALAARDLATFVDCQFCVPLGIAREEGLHVPCHTLSGYFAREA